tara:strand:+ start:67 stop:474 length:408 start_codon:yes stop_codon:yes gene_type:complete
MKKAEYNTIVKAVQGLIDDTGYTNKCILKDYTDNKKLMYDTERGLWINSYDVEYQNANKKTSEREVKVRNHQQIAEGINKQTSVSIHKDERTNKYFLSIQMTINGNNVLISSKNVETITEEDMKFRLRLIFRGLI